MPHTIILWHKGNHIIDAGLLNREQVYLIQNAVFLQQEKQHGYNYKDFYYPVNHKRSTLMDGNQLRSQLNDTMLYSYTFSSFMLYIINNLFSLRTDQNSTSLSCCLCCDYSNQTTWDLLSACLICVGTEGRVKVRRLWPGTLVLALLCFL